MKTIVEPLSFEWDHGNLDKSLVKHGITAYMAEEPFTNPHLLTLPDPTHSQNESRFHLLGSTHNGQILFITYCIRQEKIRIISARSAEKKKGQFMPTKKLKSIPKFKSVTEERQFWDTHSSVDYIDWSQAENVNFPNLKLTSKPITLRLPVSLLDNLKVRANALDVPYQSLMKIYIKQGLSQQFNQTT